MILIKYKTRKNHCNSATLYNVKLASSACEAKLIVDHNLELAEAFMDQFEDHKDRKGLTMH